MVRQIMTVAGLSVLAFTIGLVVGATLSSVLMPVP